MSRENKDYFLTPYGLSKEFQYDGKLIMRDRFFSHFFEFQNFCLGMFTYDNLPDSIEENYLEMYLQFNGTVVFCKEPGTEDLIVIRGGRTGEPGRYGLSDKYLGGNNNPKMGEITVDLEKDGVIMYNNATMSPNFDFNFYPYVLTEIEKSLLFNIRYARLAPIFEAADSDKKEAIEKLLNDIDDGKMVNVISEDILKKLEGAGGNDVLQLTDVKEIDKLQYLIKAFEDMERMYHTKFGLSERGSGKLAQQTVDEVNGSISSSFVLPLEMYYYRKMAIDFVNLKWGTNIEVHFSPAWAVEYNRFINEAGDIDEEFMDDINIEETPEQSAEESTEESTEEEPENDEEEERENEKIDS